MPSPIVTATLQAGALSVLANVLAQLIECWRNDTPFSLDMVQISQFVTYSVLSCPPNYIWQAFLEAQFPAYANKLGPSEKERLVDEAVSGRSTGIENLTSTTSRKDREKKALIEESGGGATNDKVESLSIKNTAIKFSLDQTIGAAVNTVLFIAGIALLQGRPWNTIYGDVREKFWPMTFAGQKLWPAVSILSFTIIPLEHRMLFGSVAGVLWGVYLSLIAGSEA